MEHETKIKLKLTTLSVVSVSNKLNTLIGQIGQEVKHSNMLVHNKH